MTQKKNPKHIKNKVGKTEHHSSCQLPSGEQAHQLSRRNFMKLGLGALSALAVLEAGGVSMLFLQSRSKEGEFGGLVTAGDVESFASGSVTEFPESRFFLIRAQEGGFLAVHNRCPHLGCTVIWIPEEQKFLCPCHASHFDATGDYEAPPVPRPLDTFKVLVENGRVKVDTSRVYQRKHFSPDQLTFA